MKKLIAIFLSMILLVGCSNVTKVKTIEDYNKTYLKEAELVNYNEEYLESYFGYNEQSYLDIYADETNGNIEEIELYIDVNDITSGQYEYHLEGLLKYVDSINSSNKKSIKYSDEIKTYLARLNSGGYYDDSEGVDTLIDDDKVTIECNTYRIYRKELKSICELNIYIK